MPGQAFEWDHGLVGPRVYKSCRLAPSSHGDILSEANNSSNTPTTVSSEHHGKCRVWNISGHSICTVHGNISNGEHSGTQLCDEDGGRDSSGSFVPGKATQLHEHRQRHFAGELSHSLQMHKGTAETLDNTDVAQTCRVPSPVKGERARHLLLACPATHAEPTTRHSSKVNWGYMALTGSGGDVNCSR